MSASSPALGSPDGVKYRAAQLVLQARISRILFREAPFNDGDKRRIIEWIGRIIPRPRDPSVSARDLLIVLGALALDDFEQALVASGDHVVGDLEKAKSMAAPRALLKVLGYRDVRRADRYVALWQFLSRHPRWKFFEELDLPLAALDPNATRSQTSRRTGGIDQLLRLRDARDARRGFEPLWTGMTCLSRIVATAAARIGRPVERLDTSTLHC